MCLVKLLKLRYKACSQHRVFPLPCCPRIGMEGVREIGTAISSNNIQLQQCYFVAVVYFSVTWPTYQSQPPPPPPPPPKKKKKNSPPKIFLIIQDIELCSSNIEKILIFREMKPCTFRPQPKIFSLKKRSEKILIFS